MWRNVIEKPGSHNPEIEGEQNMPPQNMPLWHVDYFELKAIKAQQTQEELFTFPLTA